MLTVEDFPAFFAELHGDSESGGVGQGRGPDPFPWQRALLDRVLADGRWPEVIDVPTGLGKTAVLDVSIFLSALRPELARRRTFFVVDRRLVVDEAHEHATRLQAALRESATPVCAAVADALRVDGDDDGEVLTVARMRGGVTWDRIWLERPDRYAVVTGTIDQVGSRLLFRGYGVREYARSIDAALVGTDSLIVVDEAHLATAFHTSVKAALQLDSWPVSAKPTVVAMSATSPGDGPSRRGVTAHRITRDDEEHPVARRRLRAAKRLRLAEVRTTKKRATADVPRALAELSTRLAPHGVVGVVLNTVSRARAVYTLLDGADAILLTGRTRPIDRDILLSQFYDRIKAHRDRGRTRPFIVVATQTIEVGANIDLDVLITESAPLPALIQRLGRLNRLGLLDSPAPAYVVHDSSVDSEDPVYGSARLAAWQWLASKAPVGDVDALETADEGLDASPAALRAMTDAAPPQANEVAPPYVPALSATTLDAWARTSPTPHPDPPVAPFLHGIRDQALPVSIVWRAGLPLDAPERWPATIDVVPPVTEETIDIPLPEARRWLFGASDPAPVADIDVTHPDKDDDQVPITSEPPELGGSLRARNDGGRPLALRYPSRGAGEVITADGIRPGDTIVVPAEYGGCDRFGWHPDNAKSVVDVADLAARRGSPVLRIGPHLRQLVNYASSAKPPDGSLQGDHGEHIPTASASIQQRALDELFDLVLSDSGALRPGGLAQSLAAVADSLPPHEPLRHVLATILKKPFTVTPTRQLDAQTGSTWTPSFPVVLSCIRSRGADDDSEAATSSLAYPGLPIALDAHQQQVAACAAQMARNLGLPAKLIASVAAAARLHDEGKRDLRFQTMLFAGRRAAAELAPEPLAKSGIDPSNRVEARRARDAAGYPRGMRHEALSARIAALHLTEHPQDLDPALVLHLVASHHGRSRPLLPPVVDKNPVKVAVPGLPALSSDETVDWESPSRFANLNTSYGRWGLALLETVVRLADIWCSIRPEETNS
ncbi:type I-U CRISPR-associated helicase/endonuclease Cas3 [Micromonospora sp. ATA32]|nr:type I-U CRISPR-associated helicase/endonuclease Cas3 [Micromonospora sp. ATA32]